MSKIRIVVADDHPVFLEGLCTVIPLKEPDFEIVGAVANGQEAVEQDAAVNPDVVLLDIKMPLMDGVEAARQIRKQHPKTKIVMLTTFNDRDLVVSALRAGANGYILKDSPIPDFIQSIKSIYHGTFLVAAASAETLFWSQQQTEDAEAVRAFKELSHREQEIVRLMAGGKDNNEIAEALFLSEKTVRNYISHIYDILGVHSRVQAVLWARQHAPLP